MTITVSKLNEYEKGKTYAMSVLYVNTYQEKYINVLDTKTGRCFKVEVLADPVESLKKLKDKIVTLVCTEVTSTGPEFELDAKYFEKPETAKKGSKLPFTEGLKVEFKTSLLFSAVNSQLSNDQPFEIVKQIAAFMNSEGGDLYLGVNDQGYVTGIERDLSHLEELHMFVNNKTDAKWSYGNTTDGFKRKVTAAVNFYLGEAAHMLLGAFEEIVDEASGLTYVKIPVRPSERDVVYLGPAEEVFIRSEATVQSIFGRQRDQYLKARFFQRGEKTLKEALAQYKAENERLSKENEKHKVALEDALKKAGGDVGVISVYGQHVKMEPSSCYPLDDKFLAGLSKPAGFVYKMGDVFKPVKTWGEFYEEMLELCASKDPEKFAELPDVEDFKPKHKCKSTKPNFVRKADKVHFTKNSKGSKWLGANRDVRANITGVCKTSFTDSKKLPLRVLAHFGIPAADIRVYKGE